MVRPSRASRSSSTRAVHTQPDYDGALFFADYSRDCIWVMRKDASGLPAPGLLQTFVGGAANPVDLQVGPDGRLYYVDFEGSVRRIDLLSGGNPSVTVNDGTVGTGTNQFEFVGAGWSYRTGQSSYLGDDHYSRTTNGFYQVRFNGTQVTVRTAKGPSHGIAAYSVDGGAETLYDHYNATRQNQVLVYTSPVLSDGPHILKVRITGTKNANATDTYVLADRVDVVGSGSANNPPTAVATATPTSGATPLMVTFDGSGSSDPDPGDTVSYAWDLDGDGQYDDSTASRPTYTYTVAGTYTARLRVTDSHGAFDVSDPISINAGNTPPSATITTPTASRTWKVGDTVAFSGSATDSEQGTLPASALSWELILHHCSTPTSCHTHPIQTFSSVASGSFTAPDHSYPSYLELKLTATDAGSLTDTETVRLDPVTVNLTIATSPAGLQVSLNGETSAAPMVRTLIQNSVNSLSAPSPQSLNGSTYVFSSWSDGGARSHNITATATATYTATFVLANPDVTVNDGTVGTGTNQFEFVGAGWSYRTGQPSYLGDDHYSRTTNGFYQVRFNGTQVTVRTAKGPSHGIAAYSVDGGAETLYDHYNATRQNQVLVYTSPVLSDGPHILKVRITGTKNANATDTYVLADRIDVVGSR